MTLLRKFMTFTFWIASLFFLFISAVFFRETCVVIEFLQYRLEIAAPVGTFFIILLVVCCAVLSKVLRRVRGSFSQSSESAPYLTAIQCWLDLFSDNRSHLKKTLQKMQNLAHKHPSIALTLNVVQAASHEYCDQKQQALAHYYTLLKKDSRPFCRKNKSASLIAIQGITSLLDWSEENQKTIVSLCDKALKLSPGAATWVYPELIECHLTLERWSDALYYTKRMMNDTHTRQNGAYFERIQVLILSGLTLENDAKGQHYKAYRQWKKIIKTINHKKNFLGLYILYGEFLLKYRGARAAIYFLNHLAYRYPCKLMLAKYVLWLPKLKPKEMSAIESYPIDGVLYHILHFFVAIIVENNLDAAARHLQLMDQNNRTTEGSHSSLTVWIHQFTQLTKEAMTLNQNSDVVTMFLYGQLKRDLLIPLYWQCLLCQQKTEIWQIFCPNCHGIDGIEYLEN